MSEQNATPEAAGTDAASVDPTEAFSKLLGNDPMFGGQRQETEPEQGEEQPEAEAEEATPQEEEPAERTYKVKVNGKELDVTESELIRGYSREQDYTHKTQAVAEERRQVEQAKQVVWAKLNEAQSVINQFAANIPEIAPPDPALIEQAPVEYLKQQRAYEHAMMQRQQAWQMQQALDQRKQFESAEAQRQWMDGEKQRLLEVLPEWRDNTKAASEGKQIAEYLTASYGIPADRLAQISSAEVVIARKAMLYDQMVSKAKAATQKVEKTPPKVERPGISRDVRATDGRTRAMQELKRSGSADAAAAVFANML